MRSFTQPPSTPPTAPPISLFIISFRLFVVVLFFSSLSSCCYFAAFASFRRALLFAVRRVVSGCCHVTLLYTQCVSNSSVLTSLIVFFSSSISLASQIPIILILLLCQTAKAARAAQTARQPGSTEQKPKNKWYPIAGAVETN